jgi:hypothetical protein
VSDTPAIGDGDAAGASGHSGGKNTRFAFCSPDDLRKQRASKAQGKPRMGDPATPASAFRSPAYLWTSNITER